MTYKIYCIRGKYYNTISGPIFMFRPIRSYLKNADYVHRQEAHLNQYNQMCYPAYAGARADEKAEHTREYVSILRRSATQYLGVRCIFEIAFGVSC